MHSETRTIVQRSCDAVLVAVLAVGLLAPMADQVLRPSDRRDTISEYRTPAAFPAWPEDLDAAYDYPQRFDAWYVDHFGLRSVLLRWHNVAKWFGLGVSPTRKIFVDSGGWIYPTEALALEDHRGAMPLHSGTLEAWRRMLEGRRDFLAARGIQYVFAVAPYKSRVYADRMPDRLRAVGPTRGQQIIEHLSRTSDVTVVDLAPAVVAAKDRDAPDDPAYFPLGVHWTDRAAHAGYAELARELQRRFPAVVPLAAHDFDKFRGDDPVDSWAGRLYMQDLLPQHPIVWRLRAPRARYTGNPDVDREFHAELSDDAPARSSLPRVQVYHDSFTLPLRAWLAEHCARLDCYWYQELKLERMDADRPDVVVQVFNEQTLLRMTPQLMREEDGGARERRFAASADVLWRFDPARFPDGLRAEGEGSLGLDNGALVHDRRAATDFLHLPMLDYPPDRDVLVRIELESPENATSQIFFRTRRQPVLDRDRGLRASVHAGRDAVLFEVPPAELVDRLTWWAGPRTGVLRIHALEVRVASGR